jgi:hypothetical protein
VLQRGDFIVGEQESELVAPVDRQDGGKRVEFDSPPVRPVVGGKGKFRGHRAMFLR